MPAYPSSCQGCAACCSVLVEVEDGQPVRVSGNHLTNRLADAILSGQPYPVEMMIGYWNNFAFSCSGARRWEQALSALPFFVHVTTNLSESSQFADIVLPAKSHLFETWGYTLSRMRGRSCLSIQAPCAPARGQVKGDEGELPFMLAQKLAEKGFPQLLEYYRVSFPGEDGQPPADGEELARNAVRPSKPSAPSTEGPAELRSSRT